MTLKLPHLLSLPQSLLLSFVTKYLSTGCFTLGLPQTNSTHVSPKPAPLSHVPDTAMNTNNYLGAHARNLGFVSSSALPPTHFPHPSYHGVLPTPPLKYLPNLSCFSFPTSTPQSGPPHPNCGTVPLLSVLYPTSAPPSILHMTTTMT